MARDGAMSTSQAMSARAGYCCQGSESTYVVARAVCAPGIEAQGIAISDNRRYAADVAIACDVVIERTLAKL